MTTLLFYLFIYFCCCLERSGREKALFCENFSICKFMAGRLAQMVKAFAKTTSRNHCPGDAS